MDPRALTRAALVEIRTILGDPALCGDRLVEAIRDLGERLAIEPFRTCLGTIAPIDRPESEAESLIRRIELHRSDLRETLGRDPGFGIAAIDYLHGVRGLIVDPFRTSRRGDVTGAALPRATAESEPLRRALDRNLRRCERSGRPLSLVVLRPDPPCSRQARMPVAAAAKLQSAVRDIDLAARILPEGFAVVLPCTPGRGGMTTADRLRRMLMRLGGSPWSAGVASFPEQPPVPALLVRRSQEAVARARSHGGNRTYWCRPERRASRRRAVGHGTLGVSLPDGAPRRRLAIANLSMSGALVRTDTRLACDERVTLELSGLSARPRRVSLPARVVRAEQCMAGAGADWSIGLQFAAFERSRIGIAGLLADLPTDTPYRERRR